MKTFTLHHLWHQQNLTLPKSQKFSQFFVLMLILSSISLSACGTLAPLREREYAETNLKLANDANASQFAAAQMTKAQNYFSTGDDLIERDKKSSRNTSAKENYLASKANSDEALYTTLAILLEETASIIVVKQPIAQKSGLINIFEAATAEHLKAQTSFSNTNYPTSLASTQEARRLLAQIKDIAPVQAVVETEKFYIVKLNRQRRDCLWRIADKFFNDPFRWKEIYELNNSIIDDPDIIQPGQRLLIAK